MTESTAPATSPERWTIRRVLEWTTGHLKKHGSDTPRLDAEVLLAHARGCQRIRLYTDYDEELSDAVRATMRELVQRRAQAEPVAYLVGRREFFSLSFHVSKDVLIPRPDTETLVLEAIDRLKGRDEPRLLDLCTGSGCIVVAVTNHLSNVRALATDVSAAAIAIAKKNAQVHSVDERIQFAEGDLFAAVSADERFDVIVANPPYVATGEMATLPATVRQHEPSLALDGGADGLDPHRRILREAPGRLAPGGHVLLEISPEQAGAVAEIARQAGAYATIEFRKDLDQQPRVLRASLSE